MPSTSSSWLPGAIPKTGIITEGIHHFGQGYLKDCPFLHGPAYLWRLAGKAFLPRLLLFEAQGVNKGKGLLWKSLPCKIHLAPLLNIIFVPFETILIPDNVHQTTKQPTLLFCCSIVLLSLWLYCLVINVWLNLCIVFNQLLFENSLGKNERMTKTNN